MTEKRKRGRPKPREIELVHPSYQPSKAELEEDVRIDATPEEVLDAMLEPVKIRCIPRPKRA